jgi:hypothetical protein
MVSPSATSIALRTNGARRDCHEFMRRFLQHVQGYGLWRWRGHAAQARLGRAHAPISLDRAELYQQMLVKYERSIVFYRALA